MIITKIGNILIDSSLLKKIDLDCLREKCHHMGCCCDAVKLTQEDINNITQYLPQLLPQLPADRAKYISIASFVNIDNKIKMISDSKNRWDTCIFSIEGKCLLEQYKIIPLFCKTFPIILEDNILKLNYPKLPCLSGDTEAYKLLSEEIILLTSKKFYADLCLMLSSPEYKDLYFKE